MVVDRGGRELFASTIDPALALAVLRDARALPEVYSVLSGKKRGYARTEEAVPIFRAQLEEYVSDAVFVDDFETVDDLPIQLSFWDASGSAQTQILPHLRRYEDRLRVTLSAAAWVDLYNHGVSKGAAVRRIQEALGIAPEECAAFGDYENDLDMMEAVAYSFAMENALSSVKERARYHAPSNSAHGVTAVCERILAGDYD